MLLLWDSNDFSSIVVDLFPKIIDERLDRELDLDALVLAWWLLDKEYNRDE